MKKGFFNYFLPSTLFNLFEIIVIVALGLVFKIELMQVLAIFIAFILNKTVFGGAMHYRDWYLCLLWSILLFVSYYLLARIDIRIALFSTVEFVFLSNVSNIKDLKSVLFWGGNKLNNNVFDWVKFNQNNSQLLDYEKKLKETDNRKYIIFQYRFREFKSYSEIAELMEIDIQRISDEIKIMSHFIEYSIRLGGE